MADGARDTVIFLDRDKFFIYDANNVLRLDFPPQIIRDMDILDKSGFDSLVDNFIKTKKLDPSRLWIVLSDAVCFSKDIVEADTSKLESEVRDFLEAIPFDQIISKRFRSATGTRIIATNLELIESLIEIFERDGLETAVVAPAAVFPGGSAKKALDSDFARYILVNKNLARQGNMLARAPVPVQQTETVETNKKKNSLLPYLLAGFGVLLIILVVVLVTRR